MDVGFILWGLYIAYLSHLLYSYYAFDAYLKSPYPALKAYGQALFTVDIEIMKSLFLYAFMPAVVLLDVLYLFLLKVKKITPFLVILFLCTCVYTTYYMPWSYLFNLSLITLYIFMIGLIFYFRKKQTVHFYRQKLLSIIIILLFIFLIDGCFTQYRKQKAIEFIPRHLDGGDYF